MAINKPYMPEVDSLPLDRLEKIFNQAHSASLGQIGPQPALGQHSVALLSPGRLMRQFLAPAPNTMAPEMVKSMVDLLPNPPKRVVSIAFTANLLQADMRTVGAAIPFLGFLIGFAYIGHSVVVFEGHPSAYEVGIQGADMLLVDYDMIPFLPSGWVATAFKLMRKPEVNVYNATPKTPAERVQRIVNPNNNPFNRPNP